MSEHNKFLKQFRAIENAEDQVRRDKDALLRNSGWKYSSSYADCYWRWNKTIEGKEITTMDVDEALRLESHTMPCDEECNHDD